MTADAGSPRPQEPSEGGGPAPEDEYTAYFNHLTSVFSQLVACYRPASGDAIYEAHSVQVYLAKMLYTIEALRKKHTYNPAHALNVDLTDSGFPNFLEMSYLGVDLLNRDRRLMDLPPGSMLKQSILEAMFKFHADPRELLWQMSERDYYEMLDEKKLFLPFTPGRCELRGDGDGFRSYVFSWACYDFRTNRPHIHILTFDQDAAADPLENKESNFHQFLEVIKAEGSRVPDVGILALAIDDDLEWIHPKVLKRICIGPLHSHLTTDPEQPLCRLLSDSARSPDDFILRIKDEIVFSERQQAMPPGGKNGKRVREVFYIPEADLDCYQHKASMIHRYLLMPHHVLQHMEDSEAYSEFDNHRKLSFDAEGNVHGL